MSDGWDDEPIGYKRPPKWSQFQKGRSGNPRGRPRKAKPAVASAPAKSSLLDDALRGERDRRVKVSGAGGSQELPMYDIVVRKLAACAAKGDVHAQKAIIAYWSELAKRDAVRRQAEEEQQAKVFKYVIDLQAQQAKKWAEFEGTGEEPIEPWPHPKDIILDYRAESWRIRGPTDERDVPYFEYCRAERDAMIATAALQLRLNKSRYSLFYVFYLHWDAQLPQRWQIRDECDAALLSMAAGPLRKLRSLKENNVKRAEQLRPWPSGAQDKDTYRIVNATMKPLLKHYGYRSLAEFERAYELLGDAMPFQKGRQRAA